MTTIKLPIKITSMPLEAELLQELERMVFGSNKVTLEKLKYVKNNSPLFLVAFHQDKPIGFKLGYVIPGKQTFFSWLGGIHTDFQQQGIASALIKLQEKTAKKLGMDLIYFTSYDRFPAMIQLGKKHNYKLIRSELDGDETKYWFEKTLFQDL